MSIKSEESTHGFSWNMVKKHIITEHSYSLEHKAKVSFFVCFLPTFCQFQPPIGVDSGGTVAAICSVSHNDLVRSQPVDPQTKQEQFAAQKQKAQIPFDASNHPSRTIENKNKDRAHSFSAPGRFEAFSDTRRSRSPQEKCSRSKSKTSLRKRRGKGKASVRGFQYQCDPKHCSTLAEVEHNLQYREERRRVHGQEAESRS